ncbi:hypothetical protein C8A03DRAFT_19539 [Achaetomium macrosporum]|uniref:Zn(2)-C6 fungal-type domain-containing protein n=1 Tax=Achaetomium macrosporum TaxID=79813 RepID=A0AAN7H6U7_9PEZI|nr:hypothetical protein C8A03DRAFT_19539 [Achaetomium macrosporum]
MVGVPTSKGCTLCLKRRVKCDEARPSCSQCLRGGRTCPGYARGMKFVDEGPKVRKVSNRNGTARGAGRFSSSVNDSDPVCSFPTAQGQLDSGGNGGHSDALFSGLGSPGLECKQIVSSFVSSLFPYGTKSLQRSFFGTWLWHVPLHLGDSEALDHAALSLALAYFGRISGDGQVLRNAELSYTRALRSLAVALADSHKRYRSEILCSTLLLGYYESFAGTDNGWVKHARGVARLMQLRGARRCYESAFDYSMFLACRGAIISEALASAEPCFLGAPEWRLVPDGLIDFPWLPQSPELWHAVFGHFAAIPVLLHEAKLMTDDTPQRARQSWLCAAQALRHNLRVWYDQYTLSDDGLRKPVSLPASPAPDEYPFHSIYVYRDVLSATILTAHSAYLLVLNREIDRIQRDSSHARENFELARAICMSVNFCSQAGLCGTQTMRLALPIAHSVLPSEYQGWTGAWISRFAAVLDSPKIQSLHL